MPPPIAELCLFPAKIYSNAYNTTLSEPLPGCLHPSLSPPWCLTVYNAPKIQTPHQSLRIRATYRDRLTSYTSNNNTVALPGATAISSPFTLNGTLVGGSCSYGLDVRYVILGFDSTSGGTLLCTSFSDVTTGSFSLVCHGGHTIRRVEVRTIDNTTITAATQTGTWTATTALGNVNLCVSTVAPTVTSTAAGGIGAGGATLGGNVTADGGATVTDRGVCYKTSSGVTISDNKTSIGTGTGVFSQGITGLGVNTRYYFNAFAINSAGTSWGTELNFWTLANVPGAPSVSNPTTSSLNVGINENGNPATTSFAIYETTQNKWVQADGSLGASAVWQTKAQWGTKTVTGLSAGTQYTFQVKARNGANVETIASGTTSGTTLAAGCSSFWHALYNRGTPLATYYLGDKLTNQFEFAISQDTTGWTVEYGLGTTTSGSGWAWRAAEWYRQVGDNREWKSKANEHQFTSVGNWYYAGQFITGGCIYYADTDWEATTGGGLSAGSYFTVNALNDPGNQSATAAGTTSISLGWAKNGQGHDVMIVRSTDSNFTAPTGGTTYTPGSSTIGGDLVVYRGGNTSFTDTGLDPSTTYYYKFYSENWSYYSVGVTASATTHTPTPTIVLADNGTQVAAGNVAAGTTAHVLSSFKVTVSVTTAKLTKVAFTTAGTYQTADISNLKLRYSTDATLDTGDATLATINNPAAAGAKSFDSLSQEISAGSIGYFFITADIASAPTGGRTIGVNGIGNADLTFASGNKSGSASAGGAQTIITLPTLTSPTATGIGQAAATLGANVTGAGGGSVSARGTVYGTSANPTGNELQQGTGTGSLRTSGRG